MTEHILGRWIPIENLSPETNIAGRDWMTKDGTMYGTFYGYLPFEAYKRGILWHFTPEQCASHN